MQPIQVEILQVLYREQHQEIHDEELANRIGAPLSYIVEAAAGLEKDGYIESNNLTVRNRIYSRFCLSKNGRNFVETHYPNISLANSQKKKHQSLPIEAETPGLSLALAYDVFISYHSTDEIWVSNELLTRLEDAGLKVIFDYRDFEIGVPRIINIERAIDNSRHTLIVMTPEWLAGEMEQFQSILTGTVDPVGRRRKLIPLLLRPCRLPRRLAMLERADLTDPVNYHSQLERVINQLKSK